MHTLGSKSIFSLIAICLSLACDSEADFPFEDPEALDTSEANALTIRGKEGNPEHVLSAGWYGSLSSVKSGAVVDEYLAKDLTQNANHAFWWFCGQSATATAINFARGGTPPTTAAKLGQLQWIHDRLDSRVDAYSINTGPYLSRIDWLYNLLIEEKSSDFTTTILNTSSRDTIKERMFTALSTGGYVVALNKTSQNGVGHFLTVYAINFQPAQAQGGTVYFGDPYTNKLGTRGFTDFLDWMLSQSAYGIYNAFSVKKK